MTKQWVWRRKFGGEALGDPLKPGVWVDYLRYSFEELGDEIGTLDLEEKREK